MNRKFAWTQEENIYLSMNYKNTINKILAIEMKAKFGYDRTPSSIQKQADALGLRKFNRLVYGQRKERESQTKPLEVRGNVLIHRII
jgi:hypothetical protein